MNIVFVLIFLFFIYLGLNTDFGKKFGILTLLCAGMLIYIPFDVIKFFKNRKQNIAKYQRFENYLQKSQSKIKEIVPQIQNLYGSKVYRITLIDTKGKECVLRLKNAEEFSTLAKEIDSSKILKSKLVLADNKKEINNKS